MNEFPVQCRHVEFISGYIISALSVIAKHIMPPDQQAQYRDCCWLPADDAKSQGPSQYKDRLSRYGDSRVKDKTVVRPSYL